MCCWFPDVQIDTGKLQEWPAKGGLDTQKSALGSGETLFKVADKDRSADFQRAFPNLSTAMFPFARPDGMHFGGETPLEAVAAYLQPLHRPFYSKSGTAFLGPWRPHFIQLTLGIVLSRNAESNSGRKVRMRC